MSSSAALSTRPEVLRLYRNILRLGREWTASSGKAQDTQTERQYIRSEARTLFRKNQTLTDSNLIRDCIREAQARVDLALHYKTPYPRPVNVPPQALAQKRGREQGRAQERMKKQSIPVYIKSHFDDRR